MVSRTQVLRAVLSVQCGAMSTNFCSSACALMSRDVVSFGDFSFYNAVNGQFHVFSKVIRSFSSSTTAHQRRKGIPSARSQFDKDNRQRKDGNPIGNSNMRISGTRLSGIATSLWGNLVEKLKRARKRVNLKILSLLLGYYSANAVSTLVGQTGDWDIIVVAIVVALMEGISFLTYRLPVILRKFHDIVIMVNFWKLGLSLGFILDKFKLEMDFQFKVF